MGKGQESKVVCRIKFLSNEYHCGVFIDFTSGKAVWVCVRVHMFVCVCFAHVHICVF